MTTTPTTPEAIDTELASISADMRALDAERDALKERLRALEARRCLLVNVKEAMEMPKGKLDAMILAAKAIESAEKVGTPRAPAA